MDFFLIALEPLFFLKKKRFFRSEPTSFFGTRRGALAIDRAVRLNLCDTLAGGAVSH